MPSTTVRLTEMKALGEAAECLRTLAHPHRLRMVQMLLQGDYTVGELAEACDLPSAMASEHLRLMQRCGFLTSEKAGLPVVRGKQAISLERQVRIAAGALVLIGALLGYFAHPVWIGLAAFVGVGLVFSGITDTCGMGMLLARMPWNQVRPASAVDPRGKEATCPPQSTTSCCG